MKAKWILSNSGDASWKDWRIWEVRLHALGAKPTWDAYKLDTINKYPRGANPYLQNFATREEAMHWCETMEAVGA